MRVPFGELNELKAMKQENALIGNYQILQEKNGIIVARDTRTDWLEQLIKLPTRWAGQKSAFQVLVQDLQAIMNLQNENAQKVDDAFEYKHAYYLALRYVEAAPLEKILRELKVLSMDEVKRLANQVGGALISAHGLGAVHGNLDIKSILVNKQGDYILSGFTDLPLSKYRKTPLKYKPGSAPELLAGEQASFASDQYSLAKLLKSLVEKAKKAANFKKSDLSQGTIDSLNKALNKDANARYTDVNAFMRAFNNGQANKNKSNSARNQAGQNSRKQELPMDFSEIPPSFRPTNSMTSGAESALSQAISSSGYSSGFFEGNGAVAPSNSENPYAMWSGVSPIEAQSHAETMRVGAGKPQVVVEDFEIGSAKSGDTEKDLSMRNIPKYKPAFDVDLSSSSSKSADAVFPFDDEVTPANPPKDRLHNFVLALGMVIFILVGVTVALLGGNTPIIKLPGSKDVDASLELNGVMQSTLAKGAFPTKTPNLISIVPIATQFPTIETETYNGIDGGLYLSPTPTTTITQTPSPTANLGNGVPGAYATAPANSGFYWDIVIEQNPEATQETANLQAVGGQGLEIYWDVQMDTPEALENPSGPVEASGEPEAAITETSVPAPEEEWVIVAPSPEPFYWDIVIDFPSPLGPAVPEPVLATPEPAAQSESTANLQTQVAALIPANTATPKAPLATQQSEMSNPALEPANGVAAEVREANLPTQDIQVSQGGSQSDFSLSTLIAPIPTPIPMLAGSEGSGSEVQVLADSKTNLVVTVVDGFGRPVADREVMVLPIDKASLTAIDTPLNLTPVPVELPFLPFIGNVQPELNGGVGRTDAFGQIHLDLAPGSFQVVYVPSRPVIDPETMAHYQVEVAAGTRTELTLHRELVGLDFINVEGEKVELSGLGLIRIYTQSELPSQDSKPGIIPLGYTSDIAFNAALGQQVSEAGRGGAEPQGFPIFDLTPGEFGLVLLGQGGQEFTPLGVQVEVAQGQIQNPEVQLGRVVLPASFLEQAGKVGDTLQVFQKVNADGAINQSTQPITSLTYQGEAVVKIDLLPGTYTLNWAGTQVENVVIRPGEASDVYIGHKGGK
jgi:serine/threonine protein kinase